MSGKKKEGRGRHDVNKIGVQFSKDYQPSPEAKSRGHQKKLMIKEFINSVISGDLPEHSKEIAKLFGVEVKDITVGMLMTFKQIDKAIKKGDTHAFNAVMDRAIGKPKQEVDVTTKGKAIDSKPEIIFKDYGQSKDSE